MIFTTSWDDGHPLDMRLAEVLARHDVGATFYCPISNAEGLPVLQASERRRLDQQGFEIGSHTHDHAYSNRMSQAAWKRQVIDGKAKLEDEFGHAVAGFCYPGGKMAPWARGVVAEAGFRYARTTKNLRFDIGSDALTVPTSLQFFPHSRSVLLRNFVRQGNWPLRTRLAAACLSEGALEKRLLKALDICLNQQGTFHLWGHSWEIDRLALWPLLDRFLQAVASQVAPECRLTNGQAVAALMRPS